MTYTTSKFSQGTDFSIGDPCRTTESKSTTEPTGGVVLTGISETPVVLTEWVQGGSGGPMSSVGYLGRGVDVDVPLNVGIIHGRFFHTDRHVMSIVS